MKRIAFGLVLAVILVSVTGPCAAAGAVPYGVAGVVLDRDIGEFEDRLTPDPPVTVRFQEYLQEVELRPITGVKRAVVAYGTCANPGRVVRIKVKYADSSKEFYNNLLKRFKRRFGEPSEWRGDPFHVLIAWKWSFTDTAGKRISLTLQHNTKDLEEKMGNAVKMNFSNGLEAEQQCAEAQEAAAGANGGAQTETAADASQKLDWELLIPR